MTNSWGIQPREPLCCYCSSQVSQRPLQFPLWLLHPAPGAFCRVLIIGACGQCCHWVMDSGREGESQRRRRRGASPSNEGFFSVLSSVSPPGSFTPHCEVLFGRKSNKLIVGRSVCFLAWINGDRMSRAQSVYAFRAHFQQVQVVCFCVIWTSWSKHGRSGPSPTNGSSSNYFVFMSMHLLKYFNTVR